MLVEFLPLEGEAYSDPLEALMTGGRAELIRREVVADTAAYLEDDGSVIAVGRDDLERWRRELDSSGAI